MKQWYLVYCKARQDDRAEENLVRQGFDVYRPTVELVKTKQRKKAVIEKESLFPRYIFVQVNAQERSLAPISSTLGVCSFVRFGSALAIVPEALIKDIKAKGQEHSDMLHDLHNFKTGEEVSIVGCGFDQVNAIYGNPSGEKRSMILMNMLGQESQLIVPNECIHKKG